MCFDEDLELISKQSIMFSSLTYPVLDIAGSSTALPRRRLDLGGGAILSWPAGGGGEVSIFCLLLLRFADGGLDSVDRSVCPESRWPPTLRFRDEAVRGGSGAAIEGSAADFAEERVTLGDIST